MAKSSLSALSSKRLSSAPRTGAGILRRRGRSLGEAGAAEPCLGDHAVLVVLLERLGRMAGAELAHEWRMNRIAEQGLERLRHLPGHVHRDREHEVLLLAGPRLAVLVRE